MKTVLAIIAVSAALMGCRARERPMAVAAASPAVWQRVLVLGPDSLVIDGRHTRLANAYGPQSAPQAHCLAEILAERETRQLVKDMMRDAHSLDVHLTGEVDAWNRSLALVNLDGKDLGDTLRDGGYAGRDSFDWCGPLSSETKAAPSVLSVMGLH